MADSIDGLTVKLSLESEDFINQMKKCESSVDKAEKELKSLDKITETASKGEKKFAEYVEKANKQLKQASDDISKAKREVNNFEGAITSASYVENTFRSSVDNVSAALKTNSDNLDIAKQKADEYAESAKGIGDGFSSIKDGADDAGTHVSSLDKLLSNLGKGIGIAAILGALNSLNEQAKETAKEYEDMAYQIYLATGTVNQEYVSAAESLVGLVPGTKSELGSGMGILATRQSDLNAGELKTLLSEYAISSKLFNQDLSTTIRQSDEAFKKWGISGVEEQIKALSELRIVCEQSDIAYSQLINTLSSGDAEFQMMGHTFTEAASMIGSASLSNTLDDLQSYLSAVQRIGATKADSFSSDEEFKNYMTGVEGAVKSASDLSQATNILTTEFGMQGMAARNVAKYLLDSSDALNAETIALKASTTTNREWYYSIETSTEVQERANEKTWDSVEALGEASVALDEFSNKAEIAAKSLYDFYGIPSLPLKDIPYLGDILSSIGITKTPEIGITIPKTGYLDNYNSILESIGADFTDESFDWKYYQNLRKQADALGIDYSDLKLQPGAGTLMESDVRAGKYDELLSRIDDLLVTLEDKQSGSNLGVLQSYLSSMQKISTSKAGLFSSDTELKEYMLGVGNAVKKAEDLSQATNILTTEFEIQGMAAQNVAKYLMGFNNAISAEDVALKAATTSNREWYQSIETSTTLQERANEVEWESVKALGDVLSSGGITKTPEIEITIPKANYLDNYPSVVESLGATLTDTSFDWKYYQNLRKQADTLGINYSDLRLQPGAGTLMESDVKAGKYDELLSRIDELLATLEKKQSGNVTVTQYISAPVADSYTIKNAAQKAVEASQASGMRLM